MHEDLDFIEAVAFHEAGHAVVAWSLGVRVIEIVVDIEGGICKHKELITFTLDPELMDNSEWRKAEKHAQSYLAGKWHKGSLNPVSGLPISTATVIAESFMI